MSLKQVAKSMIEAGIRAADPYKAVKDALSTTNGVISIGGRQIDLNSYSKVYVGAVGKASVPMARAAEEKLSPNKGYAITKPDQKEELKTIKVLTGGHPNPTKEGLHSSQRIIDLAGSADEETLFVFLVSGGGSALFCAPVEQISLQDYVQTNQLLLQSGATIHEINSVRKHLSRVKGGRFARLVEPANLVSLVVSDVVGDDLAFIASGPTVPDTSSFADALRILERYNLLENVPVSVKEHLHEGCRGNIEETPKNKFAHVTNALVANNFDALKAARDFGTKEGFQGLILSSQIEGEAREVGIAHAGIAKEIQDSGCPVTPPAGIISGGEVTVTAQNGFGKGGPNREFVLGAATKIQGREKMVVASVDTDGVDGTGKAGALANGTTLSRSNRDPYKALRTHETETFFDELGESICLGETDTNVNDLRIVLVG